MTRLAAVLLLLAAFTLTACSTPKPAPEPTPDFEVTAVSPMVAKRGQVITITGAGLGSTAGVVSVGGHAAEIISWSESEIEASVALDAPHAWQELAVENAAAESATVPRFFVGVEYGGDGAGLASLVASLDADSALLLTAGSYELPGGDANLDFRRNGLYGLGATETIVRTPGYLRWTAGSGQDVMISDLTIEADTLEISNAGMPVTSASARVVTISDASLVIASSVKLQADELDAAVLLEKVTLNAPTASFNLAAMRGVTVNYSNLTATNTEINASSGAIVLTGNELIAVSSMSIVAADMWPNVSRLADTKVSVSGDDGPTLNIELLRGACELEDNVIDVVDTNSDSAVSFKLGCGIASPTGEHTFRRNTVTVLGDSSSSDEARVEFMAGTVAFTENDITTGHGFTLTSWSTSGGSIAGNNFELGSQGLMLWGNSIGAISMVGGNRVGTTGLAGPNNYGLYSNMASLTISGDNQVINVGPAAGTAVMLYSAQHPTVTLAMTGVHFQGFSTAFHVSHFASHPGFDVTATGNHFDFAITAAPQVAQLVGVTATDAINLNGNKWGDNTNAATVRSFISPAANPVLLTTVKTSWP